MIRLVIHARADLGRECLCARLNGRHDVHLLAVGDELDRLSGRVGSAAVDAVLVLRAGAAPDGPPASARVRALWPAARLLLGAVHPAVEAETECPEGFAGWASLSGPVDELVRQLGGARPGSVAASRRVAARANGSRGGLTGRETAVLKHLALGRSARESADLLGLSPRTIDGHRRRLSGKLGRASVAELTRYAIATGLIEAGAGLFAADPPVAAKCG